MHNGTLMATRPLYLSIIRITLPLLQRETSRQLHLSNSVGASMVVPVLPCVTVLINSSTSPIPSPIPTSPLRFSSTRAAFASNSVHPPPPPYSSRAFSNRGREVLANQDIQCREKERFRIRELVSLHSAYNDITILEVPRDAPSEYSGSRILLLDESGNIHSIYKEDCNWTGSYWDQFATLPPVVPEGPIAILGLGGGTAARLILELWPSCNLYGWEIDEILVDMARMYLGLSELEAPTVDGGILQVHIGDALSSSVTVDGGFAGIMVDLFAGGEVVPQLQQVETWLELKKRLRAGGRIMTNCGGICVEKSDPKSNVEDGTWTWEDGGLARNTALKAMFQAFPGQLNWRMLGSRSDNYMALTGSLPDFKQWAAALPEKLQQNLNDWRPFAP